MSHRITAQWMLSQALRTAYYGKTILDYTGQPFKVGEISVYDDSPDPGWQISFASHRACSTHLGLPQSRTCDIDEPLPEVWPEPVTT